MKTTRLRYVCRVGAVVLTAAVAVAAVPPAVAETTTFTDMEDDAYRVPETPAGQPEPKPPMPLLSNDTADALSVSYLTARPEDPDHNGAYRVSVTLAAPPNGAYNYIVGAEFGEDCWLFHYLNVGESRPALTTCGEAGSRRSVGTIPGSRVSIMGNTIFATFGFRRFALPGSLKKDPVLGPLYILTCPVHGKSWACAEDGMLDFAYSDASFRI